MKGLSEKFARLQQEGRGHVEIALVIFKDAFLPPPPDPKEPTRLKVFVAGLPRSGTGSIAVALEQLGYSPCHGPGAMDLAQILEEHYDGRATNTDLVQWQEDHGYDAQGLDQMGWKLYKEAVKMPDTKIILTEHPRGAIAWAESWSSFVPDHIYYFSRKPFSFAFSLQQVMKLQQEFLSYIGGSNDPRDPKFAFPASDLALAYERHNEAVKSIVPADRLLVFDPTQGWGPLCDFLDVDDCPVNSPYPRMSDRQMMMVISKVAMVFAYSWQFAPILVLLLAVLFSIKSRRKHKMA